MCLFESAFEYYLSIVVSSSYLISLCLLSIHLFLRISPLAFLVWFPSILAYDWAAIFFCLSVLLPLYISEPNTWVTNPNNKIRQYWTDEKYDKNDSTMLESSHSISDYGSLTHLCIPLAWVRPNRPPPCHIDIDRFSLVIITHYNYNYTRDRTWTWIQVGSNLNGVIRQTKKSWRPVGRVRWRFLLPYTNFMVCFLLPSEILDYFNILLFSLKMANKVNFSEFLYKHTHT